MSDDSKEPNQEPPSDEEGTSHPQAKSGCFTAILVAVGFIVVFAVFVFGFCMLAL